MGSDNHIHLRFTTFSGGIANSSPQIAEPLYRTRNVPYTSALKSYVHDETVIMTVLLKKAFERASRLPDGEQDEFARHIMAELESEERWSELFNRPESEDLLARMAEESLSAHRSGQTRPLDSSDL